MTPLADELTDAAALCGDRSMMGVALQMKTIVTGSSGAFRDAIEDAMAWRQYCADLRAEEQVRFVDLWLNSLTLSAGRIEQAAHHLQSRTSAIVNTGEDINVFGQRLEIADTTGNDEELRRLWEEAHSGHAPITFVLPWQGNIQEPSLDSPIRSFSCRCCASRRAKPTSGDEPRYSSECELGGARSPFPTRTRSSFPTRG